MAVRDSGSAVAKVLELLENSDIICSWLEGDHELIPSTPTGCIFPGNESRAYVGQPRRVETNIQIFVMLYHGAVVPRGQNQYESLALEKKVVDLLEKDSNLDDDLVINVLVTAIAHGEATRGRSKYYASRISVNITSRFNIGMDYD